MLMDGHPSVSYQESVMNNSQIISEILKLEYIITSSIINGHKPSNGDKFEAQREIIKYLRKCVDT